MGTHAHSLCGQPRRQGDSGQRASHAHSRGTGRTPRGQRTNLRPIQSAEIPLKWTTDLNVEAKTVKLPAGKHRGKPSWPSEKGLPQGYRKHQLEKRNQLVFIQTRISAF